MALTPPAARIVVADVVAQQQLRQPVTGAHQIAAAYFRARTRSRSDSSSGVGTRTGESAPIINRRTRRSERRSYSGADRLAIRLVRCDA